MDQTDQNQIPQYVQKLPKAVQDFVLDISWQTRVEEIAKKYSLGPRQTELLLDKVLYILTGLEQGENFLQSIETELSISRLLATQVVSDLERRVFLKAAEYFETHIGDTPEKPKETTPQKPENSLPEIRPEILPVVEKGESVKVVPPPSNLPTENQTAPSIKTVLIQPVQTATPPVSEKPYDIDPYREPID